MPTTVEQEGCVGCPKKIHLILYAGRSLKQSDVHTFRNASIQLLKDYQSHAAYSEDTVIHGSFESGEELVEIINAMPDGSLISLDLISHGNQAGLHIAVPLNPPEPSPVTRRYAHVKMRNAEGKNPVTEEDAAMMEESMAGIYSNEDMMNFVSYYYNQKYENGGFFNRLISSSYLDGIAFLREIKSSRFSSRSFIELHGCNTAEKLPGFNIVMDNFAENFAEQVGSGSTVVGHIVNANPNHPNGKEDYRHGRVRVYGGRFAITASESEAMDRETLKFEYSSTPPLQ